MGARYGALGVLDGERRGLAQFVTVGIDEDGAREVIGQLPEGKGILGLVDKDPRALRLADLESHPHSVGLPAGHPPMGTFLGVAIRLQGEPYGNLYLCEKQSGEEFTEADEDVVSALALAAGLAIDKARLYARLRELTLSEERERIARNLHDTVIQRLFAIGLALQGALRLVGRSEAQERIRRSVEDLDETIRQIRSTIFAVGRQPRSTAPGLRAEILDLTDEAAGKLALEVRVDFDGPIDSAVGPDTAEHVLMTLREAITNVVRHAKASTVEVELKVDDDGLDLRVADDGVGIAPVEAGFGGRGLNNLTERAKLLGGRCEVKSRPEGGTKIRWRVKLLR